MLSFLESLELQIVGIWAVCFLFGFYLSIEESR
jgi:hypothetical protein